MCEEGLLGWKLGHTSMNQPPNPAFGGVLSRRSIESTPEQPGQQPQDDPGQQAAKHHPPQQNQTDRQGTLAKPSLGFGGHVLPAG